MSRVQASVITFLLLATLFAPLSVASAGTVAAPDADPSAGAASPVAESFGDLRTIEADRVEFRITVHENGSARWTFTYTRTLADEDERRQFESFAAEFEANETEAYRSFRRQANALVAAGRNATGREMTAVDFSRDASLGGDCIEVDRCGTVRMSFTWTAFARTEGDRLIVDDVFEGGLYLAEDQQFVVEAGPGLRFASAAPETYTASDPDLADSSSITWRGEQQFADRRPRAVFVPEDDSTPAVGTTDPSEATPTDHPDPIERASSTWMLLVGLLVVAIGAGVALVWRRGGGELLAGQEGEGVASEPAVADEELLSDEDRVLQLLRDNGGRMKQVDIVDETGWSKSKVSMLLSDMEEDDQISKLRVGRENIVSLVGHEPDAAGSPHDE